MHFNTRAFNAILFLLVLVLVGLGAFFAAKSTPQRATEPQRKKTTITTSFYPLFFFTKEIVADRADVYTVTPSGSEPHDYEPTPQDMANIESSDLLIINGGRFEPWATNVRAILSSSRVSVVAVQEEMGFSSESDPHIWLNPRIAKKEVDVITRAVARRDPRAREYYERNAAVLKVKLDSVDATYRTALRTCKKKVIITSHESFGYMAQEYGLEQIALSGLSPDEEPSAKKLAELARIARANNVETIFFETLVSPALAQTLAHEVGARTQVLNPIEGISDEDIASGKNYFTVIQDNLTHLKTALQCQ
jgi:zinc transport system substrate-binding protein